MRWEKSHSILLKITVCLYSGSSLKELRFSVILLRETLKSRNQWVGLWYIDIYIYICYIYRCLYMSAVPMDLFRQCFNFFLIIHFLKLLSNLVLSPLEYSILFSINQILHLGSYKSSYNHELLLLCVLRENLKDTGYLFIYHINDWKTALLRNIIIIVSHNNLLSVLMLLNNLTISICQSFVCHHPIYVFILPFHIAL